MEGEHQSLRRATKFNRNGDAGLKYCQGVFAPGAKCPNHGCRLYLTDQVGKGICEISGCYFDYDEGPVKAGDQSKNSAREMKIEIVNGQYQKTYRTMPGFVRETTLVRRSK